MDIMLKYKMKAGIFLPPGLVIGFLFGWLGGIISHLMMQDFDIMGGTTV